MILHLSFGGGGSGICFPFLFVLPPVIFLVCPLLVADVVFLSFVFSLSLLFVLLLSSSKDKEEKKNKWKKNEKG